MNHRSGRIALLLATIALLVTGLAAPASAGTPARKMALGISMMPYKDMAALDQFTADMGRKPALYSVWSAWGNASRAFPTAVLQDLDARPGVGGRIMPVLIWEPVDPTNLGGTDYLYTKIINGAHDTYLRSWAQDAKAYGKPVIVRLLPEMNGYWWPWGTQFKTNTPARFIKAWRHIVTVIRGEGATNVRFLWSPYRQCGQCDTFASVWPGANFVDYAGFSAFNWGGSTKWKEMKGLFQGSALAIKALTTRPIIVTETGTVTQKADGSDKAAWITNGYNAVYTSFPQIKAILYFNIDTTDKDDRDWRLTLPTQAPYEAYKALLTKVRFQGVIQ